MPANSGRTLVGIPAVKIDASGAIETPRSSAVTVPLSPAAAQRKADSLPFAKTLIGVEAVKVPQALVAPPVARDPAAAAASEEPARRPANNNALPSYDLTERVAVTVPMKVQPDVEAPVSNDYSIAREPETPQPVTQRAQSKAIAHWKLGLVAAAVMAGAWYGVSALKTQQSVPNAPPKPGSAASMGAANSKVETPAAVTPQEQDNSPSVARDQPAEQTGAGDERRASHLVNQGNAFRKKKMFPMARARYLEALEASPDYVRALSGLVQLSLATHRKSDAVEYARKLVSARPDNSSYQLQLGDALRAAGQESEAKSAYQEALRLGNKSASHRLR